jgi:myo-inositol-1-phosphate synthase
MRVGRNPAALLTALSVGVPPVRHVAPTCSSSVAADGHRAGLLIVGLGGNNGVTLLAGKLSNAQSLEWESREGPRGANLFGCITQVGALAAQHDFVPLADVAIGGWDVRPTRLGDALYESRVLDYDLVRQVRDEMNALPVWPGVWDADFYGESQHAGATHIIADAPRAVQLQALREDIRRFQSEQRIDGHTTLICTSSVARTEARGVRATRRVAR